MPGTPLINVCCSFISTSTLDYFNDLKRGHDLAWLQHNSSSWLWSMGRVNICHNGLGCWPFCWYEGRIWRSYMKVSYGGPLWKSYKEVLYQGPTCRSYMKVLFGSPIWMSHMVVLYGGPLWKSYTEVIYGSIWRSNMKVPCGGPIWRSYIGILYGGPIWRSYMKVLYGGPIWRFYMEVLDGDTITGRVGSNAVIVACNNYNENCYRTRGLIDCVNYIVR